MRYQNYPQSSKTILSTTRIVFLALLAGICLFLVVVLSITTNKGISFNTADPFVFVWQEEVVHGAFFFKCK